MAVEIEDFWPKDLPIADPPAPIALMERQAELLGSHTGGQVEGVVKSYVEDGTVYYSLYLKADALGDYLYKLLHVAFPTDRDSLEPFPLQAHSAFGNAVVLHGAEEFRSWLRDQLSSGRVQVMIGNLLRYIREATRTSQVS